MAAAPHAEIVRNRLPNLWEVLSRTTKAPVDLYSFYIYMRDTQRSVDYLDFWLDVSQHMSLCRHYVRGLRRSVLVDTPELEKSGSKRSSQVLDTLGNENEPEDPFADPDNPFAGPSTFRRKSTSKSTSDQRLSAFLRDNGDSNGKGNGPDDRNGSGTTNGIKHSPSRSHVSNRSTDNTPGSEQPTRPSFISTHTNSNSPATAETSPGNAVARADIRASAEKILYTYLLSGSEREIILPVGIMDGIVQAIERDGRDDPEVFDTAKDYVFQAMERDAFPGFLRCKALGNIIQPSMMLRLIVGLVAMFGAFWTAFVLIFLDYSRKTRCWLILPFAVGVYFLASHQYILDPILAFAGYSEYTFMSYQRVQEPFVRKLLNKRAMMCMTVIFLVTLVLCLIFILVPGKRL